MHVKYSTVSTITFNDMTSDTVDSRDKSDSSARQDDRNAAKQDDEHESDNGPDSVKRQILQGE